MATLSFSGLPTTPLTYDDTTPTWKNLFSNVQIGSSSSAPAHSFVAVTVSGFPAGAEVGFNQGSSTITVAGFTFKVALSGGVATITKISGSGTAPRGDWQTALQHLQIDTATAYGIANGNYTLTLSGQPTTGDTVTSSIETLDVTCFYAGTLIRTPEGDVAVESLKPGDLVLTADGVAAPVRWLGRQTVSTVFGDKLRVLPIRIKSGALAENVPARDLLVTPDHAMFIDGVLIQAGALVNGTSIVRETTVPSVIAYYHVELDNHALLVAEGAPTESFVDNVDRLRFDNWSDHEALYPDGKPVTELPYPRAKARRQVPVHIRTELADRALAVGNAVA